MALLIPRGVTHALRDPLDGAGGGRDRDFFGIGLEITGKRPDLCRHGGRQQRGLPLLGQMLHDPADIGNEAEVKHVVCLVQHHGMGLVKFHDAIVEMVEQAPRCGDDDVAATGELADLRTWLDAANDDGDGHLHELAIGADIVRDLGHEFTGRRKDECTAAGRGPDAPLRSIRRFEQRQREGRGLAGAGLGDAKNVLAGTS